MVNRFVRLHYPDYLGDSQPREGPPQTLDVSGPEGSTVEVVVDVDVPVAEATIQALKLKAKSPDQPPELVVEKTIAMQPQEGNRWSGKFLLQGQGLYRVEVRNELGTPTSR